MTLRATASAAALAGALIGLSACASVPAPRAAQSYADFLIGRVAAAREDHQVSADRYYRALAISPDDPALLEGALVSSLAVGDVARARAVADLARAHEADVPMARLLRAADALAADRFGRARGELTRIEGSLAEELTEQVLRTWAYAGDGRADPRAESLDAIGGPRAYVGLFQYQQAMALEFINEAAAARAAYQAAQDSRLWSPPAVERQADFLIRQGERDAAIALLDDWRGRVANAAIDSARARIESGEPIARTPLTPSRGAAIGLYSLGGLFLQDVDTQQGLALLTLALMLDPDLDAARLAFAEARNQTGDVTGARAALEEVSSASAYAASAQLMQAWMLMQEERGDDAVALARSVVDLDGGVRAKRALADMYRSLERYAEAEPLYSELIDAAPEEDWKLYFARGAARERIGRWSEAEADLQRALALSPDQPEVLNYLGYTWVDRGERLTEGLALIERAAEQRPQSGAIIDSLGWAYYRLGEFDRARDLLERAVELEPTDALLNDHLGDVYWRLGRRIEARFQWRRALSLEPAADDAAKIEAKLEHGMPAAPRRTTATR